MDLDPGFFFVSCFVLFSLFWKKISADEGWWGHLKLQRKGEVRRREVWRRKREIEPESWWKPVLLGSLLSPLSLPNLHISPQNSQGLKIANFLKVVTIEARERFYFALCGAHPGSGCQNAPENIYLSP